MPALAALFFLTAALYASVGFGGGSTYNALLVLSGADYRVLPSIALACNVVVVAGGVWRFGAAGFIRLERLAPWIAASIPAAFVGGRLPVDETMFVGLLGASLALAGLHLLLETPAAAGPERPVGAATAAALGAGVGLLSGVVGIGGGIFLAPILHINRWGAPKEIAGACSFFILVNSASGLFGQAMKLGEADMAARLLDYWPLLSAVIVGGQIGSRLGAGPLPETWMKRLTAALIIYVAARLLLKWSRLAFGQA
jgi:hypothetical protein